MRWINIGVWRIIEIYNRNSCLLTDKILRQIFLFFRGRFRKSEAASHRHGLEVLYGVYCLLALLYNDHDIWIFEGVFEILSRFKVLQFECPNFLLFALVPNFHRLEAFRFLKSVLHVFFIEIRCCQDFRCLFLVYGFEKVLIMISADGGVFDVLDFHCKFQGVHFLVTNYYYTNEKMEDK